MTCCVSDKAVYIRPFRICVHATAAEIAFYAVLFQNAQYVLRLISSVIKPRATVTYT